MPKFAKGQSGNPRGRPRGNQDIQNRLRAELEKQGPELLGALLDKALRLRNIHAQKFLLERLCPPAKSAPIRTDLKLSGSPAERADAVVDALAAGQLTLDDAKALLDAIGAAQAIREASTLVQRLEQLERQLAALGGGGRDRS